MVGLKFQTGIQRRKIKKIPHSTEYITVITDELNYKLSLQHKRA